MSFGKMNQKIQIVTVTVTTDTEGFPLTEETVLAETRAYAEVQRGTEKWANLAAFSTADILFRFRKIPGLELTSSMSIKFGGKLFRILSVEDVRLRGMYWEVTAERTDPVIG